MAAETLRDSLVEEIRDLYNAEKQLVKALPKLAKSATSEELRDAIESHLGETEGQVTRLERVFELLDEKPRGKHCAGMAGIIEEGAEVMNEQEGGAVLDANLIASAQRAEHYEIAAYGTAIAWAEVLDLNDVAELLSETLEEEKAADVKLSALAEDCINEAATAGESDEMDEEDEEDDTRTQAGKPEPASASARSTRRRAKSN
jgi:ferritin-like metal-binding protein YciE